MFRAIYSEIEPSQAEQNGHSERRGGKEQGAQDGRLPLYKIELSVRPKLDPHMVILRS
jgi:hypothetical protein